MTTARAHAAAVMARLAHRGYADFPFASASLLWLLDEDGTRSITLAQRAGVTKQAMSQQVKQMELQGYLEQISDLSDTRAKVVRMTPRGKAVKAACAEVRAEINLAIAKRIGKGKAREMEEHLDAATEVLLDIAAAS